jgi:hypothetical protein
MCDACSMMQIAEMLHKTLTTWRPEVADQAEEIVEAVIHLADAQVLDLLPSRAVVQELLDPLDQRQDK